MVSVWIQQVNDQVRRLEGLTLAGLRAAWQARYGPAPRIQSPDMLRRMLAWRIQEEAFGGISRETRQLILRRAPVDTLRSGERLARVWRGVRHEVEVVEKGILYRGERTIASRRSPGLSPACVGTALASSA
jgi:hypothetical protein